jgi:hypothetical protein
MRLVGIHGELAGRCFVLGEAPLTMGRGSGNHVVLATPAGLAQPRRAASGG